MRTNMSTPFVRDTNVSGAHKGFIAWSMGDVVAIPKKRGRPPKLADPNTAGGRLQQARLAAGLSQDDLAAVLLVDRSMVSKYEDGSHPMGPEILQRASRRFDISPSYILFGDEIIYAQRTARVVGRVGAGAVVEAIQQGDPDLVEVPSPLEEASAYKVTGDSCYPIFEDGDLLVVRGFQRLNPREFLGRYCVVETAQGHGFVKKVVRGVSVVGQGATFNLESPNAPTIPNVQIISARPVVIRMIGGA